MLPILGGRSHYNQLLRRFPAFVALCACLAILDVAVSEVSTQPADLPAQAAKLAEASLTNSQSASHLLGRALRLVGYHDAACLSASPQFVRQGISRPIRIRDKFWAGDSSFGGIAILILSGVVGATVIDPGSPAKGNAVRKRSDADRKRLHDETVAAVDRIAAEAHARLPRSMAQTIGAIYARFSTLFQDSAIDQIRELYEFAVADKIFVPREYVFFDLGVRSYKNQREGLDRLRSVLAEKKVQVLLLFATNRLFRKVYLTLQFVDQVAVENGIRCVFIKSGIDTANKDRWQSLLHMLAMMDEFQVRVNGDHIRAALKGMFLEGLVRGSLHLGYDGEPILGKLTKRGRPRRRIVINPEQAKIVLQVFEWYVSIRLSLRAIARRLNAMADVPKPRNSERWNANSARALLMRETYRGHWKFSVTERKFLSSKDYTRQIPRETPLEEATFEYLRIVPDAIWYAAQERLSQNRPIRGRRSKNEDADPSLRILSGLFWCPSTRPLRACSAYGNYLGCPSLRNDRGRTATALLETTSKNCAATSVCKAGRVDPAGRRFGREGHRGVPRPSGRDSAS